MYSFILKIFHFLFYLLIFGIIVELLLLINYQKRTNNSEDWHLLNDINAKIIFVGNSRNAGSINPRNIKDITGLSTYCLSQDGYGIQLLHEKIKNYLSKNTAPDYLFLQVDPTMIRVRGNLYEKKSFIKYILLDRENINETLIKYDGFNRLDLLIPLYRYKGFVRTFFSHLFGIESFNRIDGFVNTRKDKMWIGISEKLPTITYDLNQLHFIDKILDICKDNKITMIAHTMPFTNEYYQKISDNDHQKVISYLSDRNIKYIDWNKFLDRKSFDKKMFFNHTHLNFFGSEYFNQIIKNKIQKIYE